jgi:hypothetical protein
MIKLSSLPVLSAEACFMPDFRSAFPPKDVWQPSERIGFLPMTKRHGHSVGLSLWAKSSGVAEKIRAMLGFFPHSG